ncbi:MAG: site-specific integrase [Gammaproteobacteria bacterium]|nr:site-specific integrase [Gammaproteobacteria bacterium]
MNNLLKKDEKSELTKFLKIAPPRLPSVVKYFDDYTDKFHVLDNLTENVWRYKNNGSSTILDFSRYKDDQTLLILIKAMIADLLLRLAATSVSAVFQGLKHIPIEVMIDFLQVKPEDARLLWDQFRIKQLPSTAYISLKALLKFSSEQQFGYWTPFYIPFIASSLPLPSYNRFASLKAGNANISIEEESKIVWWLQTKSTNPSQLTDDELFETALLICSYQFAMRPKQIGLLRRRDCTILTTENSVESVYLTFKMIKQRSTEGLRTPLIRKVKPEWAPIFIEVYKRGVDQSGDSFLLNCQSAKIASDKITELLKKKLLIQRTATDLRHAGAIRLVDAGANSEELAEFMGHSSLETGLIYFDTSPSQAERVNQALGISETFQRIAVLGRDKFISSKDLAALKEDKQIGGVPHGIPIAGIGACEIGQPSCPFNPVTACYGCSKFLPSNDLQIHLKALEDFRGVVKYFYDASRNESDSPAYLQLKRTIADIKAVVEGLESLK